jgi:hypothetical protein
MGVTVGPLGPKRTRMTLRPVVRKALEFL